MVYMWRVRNIKSLACFIHDTPFPLNLAMEWSDFSFNRDTDKIKEDLFKDRD